MQVTKSGAVRITGRFHDGTPFSRGTELQGDSRLSISISLSPSRGSVTGKVTFANVPDVSDCAGTLRWPPAKPDQPPVLIHFVGSRYRPPEAGQRILATEKLEAEFAGGGLPAAYTESVTLTPDHKILPESPGSSALALSVAPSTGLVSGSWMPPGADRAVRLRGVVLQKQNTAVGVFMNRREAGSFILSPRE